MLVLFWKCSSHKAFLKKKEFESLLCKFEREKCAQKCKSCIFVFQNEAISVGFSVRSLGSRKIVFLL